MSILLALRVCPGRTTKLSTPCSTKPWQKGGVMLKILKRFSVGDRVLVKDGFHKELQSGTVKEIVKLVSGKE